MGDDFRVTATFADSGPVGWLADRLRVHRVEDDARGRLGGRVSVSGGEDHLFLYADSAAAAQEAEAVVRSILGEKGLQARFALDRWHAVEERWEDASQPLPATDAERAVEHERLEADQEAESQASGFADWEVRVDLPTHHDAVAVARRLEAEGQSPIRRWKYLIVGANTEDDARALAASIQADAADAKVSVEPALGMVQGAFALFGSEDPGA
jgi:hypothetical protein